MEVNYYLINNARNQRKSRNPWENKLWNYLRASRFYGLKFKRQVPIGKFIVDFCCNEKKLIIELDGGGHNEISIKDKDLNKEQYLKSQNYQVLRFWNNDLDNNLQGVLEEIKKNI